MPSTTKTSALPTPRAPGSERQHFAQQVREGLTRKGQKKLPSKYFYDAVGSALFEAITSLPEYGLTRAEQRILAAHADEIAGLAGHPATVVELGSGSGKKTRLVLEALARRQAVTFHPVELSRAALEMCERELADVKSLGVAGIESEYLEGLRQVGERRHDGRERLLALFLGSSIGNFDPEPAEEFLAAVRRLLAPGDRLLLGADLEKSVAVTTLAYDDPAGITAAFNLNLLARINRELGADFDLRQFRHQVRYQRAARRIEIHLASAIAQTVTVREARCQVSFEAGETIWTESCHKYRQADVEAMAARAGFRRQAVWVDKEWPFADWLLVVEGGGSGALAGVAAAGNDPRGGNDSVGMKIVNPTRSPPRKRRSTASRRRPSLHTDSNAVLTNLEASTAVVSSIPPRCELC